MNNVRRKSVSVWNCRMVSTIQRGVTTPCPCGAAMDTNRSTRLRHRPRVSCDPSGWDRGVLPWAAGLARCQSAGRRPLPRSREVVTPGFPANLKAGRVLVWMMFDVLCFPMSGGWQGCAAAPGGAGVVCAQKRGAKSSCCLESRRQTFRAPVGSV